MPDTPIAQLEQWAKADKKRYFEIRYLAGIAHPWAVQLDNDEHSWSVTADCHDSLFAAVRDAMSQADVELLKDKTNA